MYVMKIMIAIKRIIITIAIHDKGDDDNHDGDDSVDNNIDDGKEELALSSLLTFRMLAEYIMNNQFKYTPTGTASAHFS